MKYHPIMKTEREAQTMEDFKARHQAFTTLLDLGLVKEVPICVNVLKQVTKVMDSGELTGISKFYVPLFSGAKL